MQPDTQQAAMRVLCVRLSAAAAQLEGAWHQLHAIALLIHAAAGPACLGAVNWVAAGTAPGLRYVAG